MGKKLPVFLLLAGLCLLLYPGVSQRLTTTQQQRAIVSDPTVIGTLQIPGLDLQLPVRQGTSDAVLRSGAGLLEYSDPDSHPVLCGHRGLPEAILFRDLDQLRIGDPFCLTLGNRIVTYRVEEILVVSPEETALLLPEEGQKLCTLLTCTPYGINSHRLLIRGRAVCETD